MIEFQEIFQKLKNRLKIKEADYPSWVFVVSKKSFEELKNSKSFNGVAQDVRIDGNKVFISDIQVCPNVIIKRSDRIYLTKSFDSNFKELTLAPIADRRYIVSSKILFK